MSELHIVLEIEARMWCPKCLKYVGGVEDVEDVEDVEGVDISLRNFVKQAKASIKTLY